MSVISAFERNADTQEERISQGGIMEGVNNSTANGDNEHEGITSLERGR